MSTFRHGAVPRGRVRRTMPLAEDMDGLAEPITPVGKQHIAWVRKRGLPFGLEHHEHT